MLEFLSRPWPWYVGGPLIGIIMVLLLVAGGRQLGVSSNFRHLCAAIGPGQADYFRYDWRRTGGWNLAFAAGILLGGFLAVRFLGAGDHVAISAATHLDLAAIGITNHDGLAPVQLFSWAALLTPAGFICIVVGGFLVGFGASWAGGCTSGHAIAGLADLQLPSLIAVVGFFVGGLVVSWFLLPLLVHP